MEENLSKENAIFANILMNIFQVQIYDSTQTSETPIGKFHFFKRTRKRVKGLKIEQHDEANLGTLEQNVRQLIGCFEIISF